MTTLQLLIVCASALFALAIIASARAPRTTTPVIADACDLPLEAAVSVVLTSGTTVRGRVVATGKTLRLAESAIVTSGQTSPVAGIAVIPAGRIDWAQEL